MLLKRALTGDGGIARCRDARTPVEQAICSDPALAAKIADRGEVDEAGRNGVAGDVRHPQLVGSAAADQVAREVVLPRQPVEGRAGGVLLHDLLLEREAVDAMTCHEPYSCKAQLPGQSSAIVVSGSKGALHWMLPS